MSRRRRHTFMRRPANWLDVTMFLTVCLLGAVLLMAVSLNILVQWIYA